MPRKYDVIVIGSGIAGLTAAYDLKKAGKKVAIIESTYFGGVVANCGSTRKKKFVSYAELVTLSNQMLGKGIKQSVVADWPTAMAYVNASEDNESLNHEEALNSAGITSIYGRAKFIDSHNIKVDSLLYEADYFVISTGARPRKLNFPGSEYLSNSSEFLTQSELPKRIVILGAGIIAFAFATIANAFGAEVTILQHDNKALAAFDEEMVQMLIDKNKRQGIDFRFNQPVSQIKLLSENKEFEIETSTGNFIITDKIYSAVGRVPNIEALNLEKVMITAGQHGIDLNDCLQSSQPHIYACGDCANTAVPKLVPYAAFEGKFVADHIIGRSIQKIKYPMPSMSTFSQPKIAQVGVSTNVAINNPNFYEIKTIDMKDWLDYSRVMDDTAILKIVIRKSDKKVVGVTSLSDSADILINYATLAITAGFDKEKLMDMLFSYPSIANDMGRFF